MAPNGATSRKIPAVATKPAKTEESIPLESLFDELNDVRSDLKDDVKENLPVLEKPGSWDSKTAGGANSKDASTEGRSSLQMNRIPAILAHAFPNGKLMGDKPDVLRCNHCKRPVLKHAMPAHIERCRNKKQEKQRKKKEAKDARDAAARKERGLIDDDEDEDGEGMKRTASKTGGLTASKKRKAADEGDEGVSGPTKKKKKKDEGKTKAPKPKAPVDVEKQCGVELANGGQCARSLTCKSHSMGAKRAVPGRSAPYDKLLMEYQRKNQAKLQKAAFDANAPDPDDDRLDSGPVDSEEEKEAMMTAISRSWGGRPLYQPSLVPLKRKYEYNRIKGMLAGGSIFGKAASGGGGGFFGSAPAPAPNGPMMDENAAVYPARRGSMAPGSRSVMAPGSRKPSVASVSIAT